MPGKTEEYQKYTENSWWPGQNLYQAPLQYRYAVLVLYQPNQWMTVKHVQTTYYADNNTIALKFQSYVNGNNIYHVSSQ